MLDASDKTRLSDAINKAPSGQAYVSLPSQKISMQAKSVLKVLLGVLLVFIFWLVFAWLFNSIGSSVLAFPNPFEAFYRLYEYMFEGKLLYGKTIYAHTGASIMRLIIGFSLAALLGVSLGSLLGYFSKIYTIGMVPVSIFQMIPGLAWLPIAILLFGLGNLSAVFIIFIVSSMVITTAVAGAIRTVPETYLRAARMMGKGGFAIFFTILLPYASVSIISALRVGMSSAWRVLIAAEMIVGTGVGIGYSIELTRDLLDYVGAFSCIIVICLFGLTVDRLVLARIEKTVSRRLGIEA